MKLDLEDSKKAKYDPNIVGLDQSSSDGESSDTGSEEVETVNENRENVKNGETMVENGNKVVEIGKQTSKIEDQIDLTKSDNVSNSINNLAINKGTKGSKDKSIKKETKVDNNTKTKIKDDLKKPLPAPTKHIEVKRDPKVQVARLKLPILGEEQRVMELINENEFLIVAGETGNLFFTTYFEMGNV